MPRWIKCPGCDGDVGVPDDWAEAVVTCPNCEAKVAVKLEGTVQWRPSHHEPRDPAGRTRKVPGWFLPAGLVSSSLAAAAFLASAVYGGGGTVEGALLAGALNPLFFIGGPLGAYWLFQWKRYSRGENFFCPYCDAGLNYAGPRGDVLVCWKCKKRLRKP